MFEQYRRTNCVVSDLIMGNEYVFRVYAANMVGLSPEPCLSKDSAYIQKTGDSPHSLRVFSVDLGQIRQFYFIFICLTQISSYTFWFPSQVLFTSLLPTKTTISLRPPSSRILSKVAQL